jgi:hypothetical protein
VLVYFEVFVYVLARIWIAFSAASLLGVCSYIVEGAMDMMPRLIDPSKHSGERAK